MTDKAWDYPRKNYYLEVVIGESVLKNPTSF
jgi:hypothetical protein